MNKNYKYILRLFFLVISALFLQQIDAQINFTYQSGYKYIKGSEADTLPTDWMTEGFDDSGWSSGTAPFHYGDGFGGVDLGDMINNYSTIYLRSTFTVSNIELINQVVYSVDYDDGYVIWINGEIVLQQNAPAVIAYNSFATLGHESGIAESGTLTTADLNLKEGINTIAIMGLNISLESTDFYFDMQIEAETSTPALLDTIGISFSKNSGFYASTFDLIMTSPDPSANLVYTIDGSNPQNSPTAITTGNTTTLSIDQTSSAGRAVTPGFLVRASIVKGAYKPSLPETRTYIFIESVKTQSYPGGGWPNTNVNGQNIDLDMDPDILNDSRYTNLIDDALLAVPTLSIVTDLENLFDPATGIYVNAYGHGAEWERECSFELIDPQGSEGFNVNAGIRIRGGYSRNSQFPKHSFRLFFKSEYGDAKLNYPLFEDEGVSTFDKIDLRTAQNYSWANGDSRNSMVREIFSRDTQRDMGQPYTRSRNYNLYVNGMYWGLYETQERSEANYASDYLGGKSADYDVIKVATENGYQIEATDGTTGEWSKIWNLCNGGLENSSNYYKLEGKNSSGFPDPAIPKLVDIDNLIDYMLIIFYTGNVDAPVSSFIGNKRPNNFYAIKDRTDNMQGFKFFAHDSEHSLFNEASWPSAGLSEDRVNIPVGFNEDQLYVESFSYFHPQWLHSKLTANAEYRMRFADRAYEVLQGEGVLTPSKARIRFDQRVTPLQTAVIAESARWGDGGGWSTFTKDDNWIPEINKVRNNYLPLRTNILIEQLKAGNLYPSINPPVVKKSGTIISSASYMVTGSINVAINNPNSIGTMYYTLDGTDPRTLDGAVSSSAVVQSDNFSMDISSTTIFNSRVYDGTEWSSLKRIDFLAAVEDYTNLRVTELNYHPMDLIVGLDTTFGQDFEFIEFKNTGTSSINLANLVIDSAIFYEFPTDAVLGPNQFWVVASKPSKFYDYFGLVASGNFSSNFSNGGEKVLLRTTSGTKVMEFVYDDSNPWPERPDGDGYSLVSALYNPTGDPNDPYYWRSSILVDGSPFKDDDGIPWGVKSTVDLTSNLVLYPNPATELIHINFKSLDALEPLHIKMYNLSGSLVYQNIIENNSSIDLGTIGLRSGLFIVSITSKNITQTVKLIYTPE